MPAAPRNPYKSFRTVGILFATLGALAMTVPATATVIVEQLVAWLMLFWGIAGLLFARSFKALSEWKIVAAGFVVVALVGLFFLLSPGMGAAFMTALLIAVFLMEGILSILLGLRMSGQVAHWQWIVASGACSFLLGAVILSQWPRIENWIVGFLVGLNFLSTGIAMLLVARAANRVWTH